MTTSNLPATMGTFLIVAGLALMAINIWRRTDTSEKTNQAGGFILVVGAFLLAASLFVPHAG